MNSIQCLCLGKLILQQFKKVSGANMGNIWCSHFEVKAVWLDQFYWGLPIFGSEGGSIFWTSCTHTKSNRFPPQIILFIKRNLGINRLNNLAILGSTICPSQSEFYFLWSIYIPSFKFNPLVAWRMTSGMVTFFFEGGTCRTSSANPHKIQYFHWNNYNPTQLIRFPYNETIQFSGISHKRKSHIIIFKVKVC